MNPDKMRGSKEGIREIQSPLGDGNKKKKIHRKSILSIREIQSPLGDGNDTFVFVRGTDGILEKYSPR